MINIPLLLLLLISNDSFQSFWFKLLLAFVFLFALCLLFKFGLRRFRFKDRDLKAAGLNHRERKEWRSERKRRLKYRGRKKFERF